MTLSSGQLSNARCDVRVASEFVRVIGFWSLMAVFIYLFMRVYCNYETGFTSARNSVLISVFKWTDYPFKESKATNDSTIPVCSFFSDQVEDQTTNSDILADIRVICLQNLLVNYILIRLDFWPCLVERKWIEQVYIISFHAFVAQKQGIAWAVGMVCHIFAIAQSV
jgi:hypothetical protein